MNQTESILAGGGAQSALVDRVYVGLLDDIITGRLAPGSRVKEREVSDRFETSRVPVRQAIQRLQVEGFVHTEPNRGAVVWQLSLDEVNELFDARLCIEPYGARLAAIRVLRGQADASELKALLEEEASVDQGRETRGLSPALQLHAEIIRLSGNGLLMNAVRPMLGRMEWIFRITRHVRDQTNEHQQLYEAIVAGDVELAGHLAYTHIQLGRGPVVAALRPLLRR